ncbi:hypothetical protein [Mesorhizobium sp.]|nr:hypothetical protein [Mesorhizobium sp.]
MAAPSLADVHNDYRAAVGNDPDEPSDLFGMLLRAASAKTAQPAL